MTPGIDNIPSLSPYSTFGSKFTHSFQQFVKDIADCKSKTVTIFFVLLRLFLICINVLQYYRETKQNSTEHHYAHMFFFKRRISHPFTLSKSFVGANARRKTCFTYLCLHSRVQRILEILDKTQQAE